MGCRTTKGVLCVPFVVDEDNWFFLNAMGEIHNGGSPSSLLLFLNVFLVFDCRSLGDDSVGVTGPSQGVWPEVFQFCTAQAAQAHQGMFFMGKLFFQWRSVANTSTSSIGVRCR